VVVQRHGRQARKGGSPVKAAEEKFVEDTADGPDVALFGEFVVEDDFGGEVGCCASFSEEFTGSGWGGGGGEAKVCEFEVEAAI
jgi:hypothetical protein